jgi:hypothetical protein
MKKTIIFYWIITGLFAALMLLGSIPDILSVKDAVDLFHKLEVPAYLLPFLGVAKTLGVIAILVPGFPALKYWAYAGLTYDLIGAGYCTVASGQPISGALFMIVPIAFCLTSYWLWRKKTRPN